MSSDFLGVLAVACVAAVASPLGGLIALWREPTTLFMSVALGFAGGVLLGTIGFEMLPKALDLSSTATAAIGFAVGFCAIYAFDLFVHRGRVAGPKAEQEKSVKRHHARHRPRGDEVTVLAGGTSTEEVIEGISIGVGTAIQAELGMLVALAIAIDNVAEALSIGELIRSGDAGDTRASAWRVLKWTGLIGASLLVSALAGWFLLRGLPHAVLGFLFATGAGGMFYLTVTDLVPEAAERHYQQSGGLAIGAGFVAVFVISRLS